MNWRRVAGSTSFGTDWPYSPFFCSRQCACPQMRWRARRTTRSGSAVLCAFVGSDYGEEGLFRRVDTTISGVWRRDNPTTGAVVKNCASTGLYSTVSGIFPDCVSDSGGTYSCAAPPGYDGIPLYYRETSETTVSNQVGDGEAAEAARGEAATVVTEWSDWDVGLPTLPSGTVSFDTRAAGSASFSETTWEIEFAGAFYPFMIRRRERVTTSYPGTGDPSTFADSTTDLEVLTGDLVSINWSASANQACVILGQAYFLPQ